MRSRDYIAGLQDAIRQVIRVHEGLIAKIEPGWLLGRRRRERMALMGGSEALAEAASRIADLSLEAAAEHVGTPWERP